MLHYIGSWDTDYKPFIFVYKQNLTLPVEIYPTCYYIIIYYYYIINIS